MEKKPERFRIRPLKSSEVDTVAQIATEAYSDAAYGKLAKKDLLDMFSNSSSKPSFFVAESKGKIVGFAGYMMSWADWRVYDIFWVTVLPEYQRRGVGKKLMKTILNKLRKDKGVMLVELTSSLPMYFASNFGFRMRQQFERVGKECWLMTLQV